jgi:hypothetical protein
MSLIEYRLIKEACNGNQRDEPDQAVQSYGDSRQAIQRWLGKALGRRELVVHALLASVEGIRVVKATMLRPVTR